MNSPESSSPITPDSIIRIVGKDGELSSSYITDQDLIDHSNEPAVRERLERVQGMIDGTIPRSFIEVSAWKNSESENLS